MSIDAVPASQISKCRQFTREHRQQCVSSTELAFNMDSSRVNALWAQLAGLHANVLLPLFARQPAHEG